MLRISSDLSLTEDAATQTFAFIARKGAGKTYAAGKFTELLLESGAQVVVLDPVGNWYGLRIAADGKGNGFDVPVFGGLRGDLPLEATAGELVADVAVDTARSLVLDISQFSLADRRRFATSFGERLWKRKKGESHPSPIMLVIEESQLIVPQNVGKDEARMVGIYEEIIRLGRNYGIGAMMISQRPQSVNKEVLNQTECLFVLQVNGAQERKALRDWIVHQGMDVSMLNELPSLPVGTAYVWSPQWLGILKKVRIGKKVTFDASATPKVGQKQIRRNPAPLDLNEIEQRMESIVEKAKADDPLELRRKIAALEKELADAKQTKPAPERVEVSIIKPDDLTALQYRARELETILGHLREYGDSLSGTASRLTTAILGAQRGQPADVRSKSQERRIVEQSRPAASKSVPTPTGERSPSSIGNSGKRRILIALAQNPAGVTASKLSLLTGLSKKSGTWSTYLSSLRSSDYIESRGSLIAITRAGLDALGAYDPLPTGEALIDYWRRELGDGGLRRMFDALIEAYPRSLSRDEIGDRTGLSTGSGTFSTYLARLRTLELAEGRGGEVRASGVLFE